MPEPSSRLASEWRTGPHGIPTSRYTDPGFASLEAQRLWPRVWQMACRLDQLKFPGDYVVYDIAEDSVIVVRVDDSTVKAYHNVCPHRATALALGTGRFQLETITCPFHGWKWNLRGESVFVLDRCEFIDGRLSDEYLHLHECQVAIWMGSVWINMDLQAEPFEKHVAPIRALIDPLLVDQMKFYWHKSAIVPANWKVSQEAFFEGYHVVGTHPQLLRKDENPIEYNKNLKYFAFDNGHGVFNAKVSSRMGQVSEEEAKRFDAKAQLKNLAYTQRQTFEQHDALVLQEEVDVIEAMTEADLAGGVSPGQEYQRRVRALYAGQKRPIATPEALEAVTDCHIFPNVTFLPIFGNVLMYRVRPTRNNDPNWCIFDMYSLRTYPEGQAAPDWQTESCDDLADPAQFRLVPRQDFSNVPRQQQGMRSRAITSTILSDRQEIIIMNMHRELDRYLGA